MSSGDAREPIVVVNIVAVSYSGSTWVNFLLGASEQAFSIGEIDQMARAGRPLCTLHAEACPVWSRFDASSAENPYLQVARLTGRRFLVVNNTRRYLDQQRHPGIARRFLWIVRDGRAAVASRLRKYPDDTTASASRGWVRATLKKERLIREQPDGATMRVVYEHFKEDTSGHLQRVCGFLGLDYDPAMLEYWERETHYLGGNPGSLSTVARRQGLSHLHYVERDGSRLEVALNDDGTDPAATSDRAERYGLDHYARADPSRFSDERWRAELDEERLAVFDQIAGRLNRRLGYGGLAERRVGLRRRLGRMRWSLRRRLGPLRPVVLDYDAGMKIQVRPIDRLGRRVFLDGYSDREHAVLLDAVLRPGMVYFDVGANFGQFALMAASRVGRGGSVHAFEATTAMYEQLAANVALNGLEHVHARHAAVADEAGELEMTLCAPGKEAFSSLGRPMRPAEQIAGHERVEAVTLDGYCDEAGVERIDLLKIDVEGAELKVITGASRLLAAGRVDALVCEFNEIAAEAQGSSGRRLREALESHGLTMYRFDAGRRTIALEPPVERYGKTENLLALRDPEEFAGLLKGA